MMSHSNIFLKYRLSHHHKSNIFAPVQILQNTAADDRVGVNDGADDAKLFALAYGQLSGASEEFVFATFRAFCERFLSKICFDIGCLTTFNILQ